jgi:FSR family fosmidomycin resistance protein-like MFS transporter
MDHHPAWTGKRFLVRTGGAARHRGAVERRRLVQAPTSRQHAPRSAASRRDALGVRAPHRLVGGDSAHADFSKYFYLASITSYYSFYLIDKFHLPVRSAQLYLFVFLLAVALGSLIGGPMGDKLGRKRVIWFSILGVAPFTMALPHADLAWTGALSFIIGLILASAFSAILVFAQDLMPGKVGAVSGLFFGFAFGMGGIGAAVLGGVADRHGIEFVYHLCAYLPLIGIIAVFLPDFERS